MELVAGSEMQRANRGRRMHATTAKDQLIAVVDTCALAQSIVDTIHEPVLVLDKDLRVVTASRFFYSAFNVSPEDTQGRPLHRLGDGQWNIPSLRLQLKKVLVEPCAMDGYEVEHDFPDLGRRAMRLNARPMFGRPGADPAILLGIEDITERRGAERERDEMLRQKDILLDELQHRVANSLQIVASIILLKAKQTASEESRHHLQDAHKRVMSIAAVQQHLHLSGTTRPIEIVPYLSTLCKTLAASLIGDVRPVAISVIGEGGRMAPRHAESLGLITIELVMNALKHAFTGDCAERGIAVRYEASGTDWALSIADNGVGKAAESRVGLGTGIVRALAQQLDAQITTVSSYQGTNVMVARGQAAMQPPARAR